MSPRTTFRFKLTATDDETGDETETEHEVPAVFEVCGACDGHGTRLTPSLRDVSFTPEELGEWDDEERNTYFTRGGMYDVRCEECHGNRVTPSPFVPAMNAAQRAAYEAWCDQRRDLDAMEREMAAERSMGA